MTARWNPDKVARRGERSSTCHLQCVRARDRRVLWVASWCRVTCDGSVDAALVTGNVDTSIALASITEDRNSARVFWRPSAMAQIANDNPTSTPNTDATQCKTTSTRIKRPLNAFFAWSQRQRRILNARVPRAQHTEISKLLGARFALFACFSLRSAHRQ